LNRICGIEVSEDMNFTRVAPKIVQKVVAVTTITLALVSCGPDREETDLSKSNNSQPVQTLPGQAGAINQQPTTPGSGNSSSSSLWTILTSQKSGNINDYDGNDHGFTLQITGSPAAPSVNIQTDYGSHQSSLNVVTGGTPQTLDISSGTFEGIPAQIFKYRFITSQMHQNVPQSLSIFRLIKYDFTIAVAQYDVNGQSKISYDRSQSSINIKDCQYGGRCDANAQDVIASFNNR
jgi:hypothetical protein